MTAPDYPVTFSAGATPFRVSFRDGDDLTVAHQDARRFVDYLLHLGVPGDHVRTFYDRHEGFTVELKDQLIGRPASGDDDLFVTRLTHGFSTAYQPGPLIRAPRAKTPGTDEFKIALTVDDLQGHLEEIRRRARAALWSYREVPPPTTPPITVMALAALWAEPTQIRDGAVGVQRADQIAESSAAAETVPEEMADPSLGQDGSDPTVAEPPTAPIIASQEDALRDEQQGTEAATSPSLPLKYRRSRRSARLILGLSPATRAVAWSGRPLPAPPTPYSTLTAEEVKTLPPPEWLADELLQANALAVLFGQPGTFKSFLTLDLSLCIAGGWDWHGRTVKQGTVLYVAAEGASGFRNRIRAWEEARGREAPEGWHFLRENVPFLQDSDVSRLIHTAQESEPAFIVIDTLSRAIVGGDENSSDDMGRFVEAAERLRQETGAAVLFVHHAEKAKGTIRGSTVLPGAVNTILRATRDGVTLRLTCEKQKEGPDGADFPVLSFTRRVIDLGGGESSVVLDLDISGGGRLVALVSLRSSARAVYDALTTFGTAGASNTEWRHAAMAKGMSKSTFDRNLRELVDGGLVTLDGKTYRLADLSSSDDPGVSSVSVSVSDTDDTNGAKPDDVEGAD